MASAISTVELADDRAKGSRERRRLKTPAPLAFLDLAAISLLRDVLPVDEPVVRRCMNPYEAGPSNNGDHPGKHFVEFLRTATIFLLDDRETRAALNSRPPDELRCRDCPIVVFGWNGMTSQTWVEWARRCRSLLMSSSRKVIVMYTNSSGSDSLSSTQEPPGMCSGQSKRSRRFDRTGSCVQRAAVAHDG